MLDETAREVWAQLPSAAVGLLLVRAAYLQYVRAGRGWGGAWLALALWGQMHALRLYDAGPRVSYHHYRLTGDTAALLGWAAVGLQALIVGAALVRHRAELGRHITRPGTARIAALATPLMLLAAAKISRPASRSAIEFTVALAIQLVALGNLWLFARSASTHSIERFAAWFERVFGASTTDEPEPGGADRFAWTLALVSTLLAALLNVFVYERMPHVPDEVVYLFHARYLAAGELFLAPPPVPAAFDLDLMLLDQGKWYCPVPLGWPLALAVGAFCGVPWLVNPLLGGATVLVVYALLRELTSRRNARIAIALLALSPWFVFLNMSFMTHPLTLLAATCAALSIARSRRTGSVVACLAAGLAIGVATLVRPLDGALLAVLLGLWSIGLGGARLRVPAIAALVVSTAVSGLATLPYNRALTGDALRFPIQRYVDVVYGPGKNDMGFGPEKGLGWGGLDPWPGHSLFEALVTAQFNVFSVNAELFGWGTGSLVLVWIWLVLARWRSTDRAMAVFVAAIIGSSLLYWFNGGPDFGARYWHLILVPLVWASVRGLGELERRLDEPVRALAAVAALVALSVCTWIPWRALDKYSGYRGVRGAPRTVVEHAGLERDLVLVQGDRHPDFAALAWLNPPRWDADAPIFAWARDPQTCAELMASFRDRPLRIARPSAEHDKLDLSAPLSASAAWTRLELNQFELDWTAHRPSFDADGAIVAPAEQR